MSIVIQNAKEGQGQNSHPLAGVTRGRGMLTVMDYHCLGFQYKSKNGANIRDGLENSDTSIYLPHLGWRSFNTTCGETLSQSSIGFSIGSTTAF